MPASVRMRWWPARGFAFICAHLAVLSWIPAPAPGESIDPVTCRACHRDIYDRYSVTPMARSFYSSQRAEVIEDWGQNNRFHHQPSGFDYEMTQRDGQFYVRRYQRDDKGQPTNVFELRVTHIMGSGTRARSYLHRTAEGRLIELPVSWYAQERRWAMAPGYDRPRHPDFARTVNHKCMFCHNAYPDVPVSRARQGWDTDVRFPATLPSGIDCQRCHGPGGQHVRDRSARSIVNPARLSPERQMDVCMQCHLETTTFRLPDSYRRFGRGFYSYTPGEPLGDYIVHFDHEPGKGYDEKFEIVSSAYRLRKSACFLKSEGRLVCTTCHTAHATVAPAARASHYRERCLTCHSSSVSAQHKMDAANFAKSDCLPCHMPLRRTEDVVHVAMTDHRIMRHLPEGDLLAPRREKRDAEQQYLGQVVFYYPQASFAGPLRDVYLGIAQVKDKANLKPGIALLEQALRRTSVANPEPYFELAEAQTAVGLRDRAATNYLEALNRDPAFVNAENNLANLLAASGRLTEAIVRYRRGLQLDPGSGEMARNLGLTLIEAGQAEAAEQAFRAAVKADPMYAPAWRELGSLLLSRGDAGRARTYLERALTLTPSDARVRNNLGLALLAVGERSLAISHLRVAAREGDPATARTAAAALKRLQDELPRIPQGSAGK